MSHYLFLAGKRPIASVVECTRGNSIKAAFLDLINHACSFSKIPVFSIT